VRVSEPQASRSHSSWRLVAGCVALCLLVFFSLPHGGLERPILAALLLGFTLVFAALSAALASSGARQDVALCTLIGAAWAFAVGFARYWSTSEWFRWVDTFVISSACLFAQARLSRKRSLAWIVACSLLLVPVVLVSGVAGNLARALTDDPRM